MNLKEILERKLAIKNEVLARGEAITAEEIDAFNKELDSLEAQERSIKEKEALNKRMADFKAPAVEVTPTNDKKVKEVNSRALRGVEYKKREKRDIELRASGDVTNTSAKGILLPSHVDNVVDVFPWNQVSSIVDVVKVVSLPNGNDYTKAFETSTGEGAYTLEATASNDGNYSEVTSTFDSVTIKRNKVTALTYMSEELQDLPDADYATLLEADVSLALKKKIAKEIVLGDGTGAHFVGVACPINNETNMNANTFEDKELNAIDEHTLMNMVIDFGGDENVEDRQLLLMNKLTLKAFAQVRGSDKKPVYNITITGNTFTIDGVRGVFTAHLKPISTASSGDIWAVYGDFSKYNLLDFGGEAINTSTDFKFNQGVTAVRGRIYAGGGLAGYKAFNRYHKTASL